MRTIKRTADALRPFNLIYHKSNQPVSTYHAGGREEALDQAFPNHGPVTWGKDENANVATFAVPSPHGGFDQYDIRVTERKV